MGELEGIDQDVPFDWDGAEKLVARFRSAAKRLDEQVPRRQSDATAAREEWRGLYAQKFDGHVTICTSDAKAIAGAMRGAALKLEELARLAQEEQDRRVKARAWAEEQRNKSLVEKVTDEIGITSKDDDKPPPVDYGEGRRYTAEPHQPGQRD
jgi:uncharacterized protein YukE